MYYPARPDPPPQLPMTKVAHATRPPEPPPLLERMKWAYGMIAQHDLTTSQGPVLVCLAYRAATGSVWESQRVIASAIGASRATVQRSLYRLVDLGLIVERRRFADTTVYQLTWGGLEHTFPMHHRDASGLPHSDVTMASERGSLTVEGNSEKEEEGNRADPGTGHIKKWKTEDRSGSPNPAAVEIWHDVLGELRECIPKPSFDTWFEGSVGLALVDIDGVLVDTPAEAKVLVVSTPNAFVAEMLERRMANVISQAVREVTGSSVEVEYQGLMSGRSAP